MDARSYMTIKQAAKKYPWSEGGFRWLWFNGEKNGFASCVRKCGKKILIDEALLVAWIESGSAAGK